METQQRTHLVNQLMEEAQRMMGVLEKAVEGQESDDTHPTLHGSHHSPRPYSVREEHAAWEKVCEALHDIQADLEQIAQAEHHRLAR